MRKYVMLFFLFLKRRVLHVRFLFLLLLFPVCLLLLNRGIFEKESQLSIGLFHENDVVAEAVCEALQMYEGWFAFSIVEDIDSLKRQVENESLECAYIFPKDFSDRMMQGDSKECVSVIRSPGTTLDAVVNEVVFSYIFSELSVEILKDCIWESGLYTKEMKVDLKAQIEDAYREYRTNDSTFSFAYGYVDTKEVRLQEPIQKRSLVRGVGALFLFMTALLAALECYKEEEQGVFPVFTMHRRLGGKICLIASAVFPAAISVFVTLLYAGEIRHIGKELLVLCFYVVLLIIWVLLLKKAVRYENVFTSMIIILSLAVLIFCPILIDLAEWVPAVGIVKWMLPPTYYLELFFS